MSNSHFIWRRIAVTKDREELTSAAWEYLQKVASALMTTDFSGNKAVLGDKLLNALGYEDWPDLRKSSKLEHELSFILDYISRNMSSAWKLFCNFFYEKKCRSYRSI